jgi:hypothetical protein
MVCGACGKTTALHLRIELLRMFRGQPVQAMRADSRYEVFLDVDPVASVCVLGHMRRRGDVLDPVSEPARHCPPLARLWNTRRVTQFLQLANLADNFGLLPAHDVATVGTAIVAHTHGYSAVPVAVAF